MEFPSSLKAQGLELCLNKKPDIFAKRVSFKITVTDTK